MITPCAPQLDAYQKFQENVQRFAQKPPLCIPFHPDVQVGSHVLSLRPSRWRLDEFHRVQDRESPIYVGADAFVFLHSLPESNNTDLGRDPAVRSDGLRRGFPVRTSRHGSPQEEPEPR